MKAICVILSLFMISPVQKDDTLPGAYREVDQVIWIVSDLDHTLSQYAQLGFSEVMDLGKTQVKSRSGKGSVEGECTVLLARANLGGAIVNWIQPLEGHSLFHEFREAHGDGAMSLVHRFPGEKELKKEIRRLDVLGIGRMGEITLVTSKGDLEFILMDTGQEGKFILGFTQGRDPMNITEELSRMNRHSMKLNQYAFAIQDPDPVSGYWQQFGLPAFEINHPELGETRYYGELVDHSLIQGWQRHGTIAYEWCIPVKPPIVYEDHIQKHGEGIHHLAFSVEDMDRVLNDFKSRGFVVSMGGTWGEKGKPGSGRYEYIDLEQSGGLTMELLWSHSE